MPIGAWWKEVLRCLARLIEAHSEGMLCSLFLLDADGVHLRYGVAADLPQAYRAATDGVCIGPNVGSCGAAAYLVCRLLLAKQSPEMIDAAVARNAHVRSALH